MKKFIAMIAAAVFSMAACEKEPGTEDAGKIIVNATFPDVIDSSRKAVIIEIGDSAVSDPYVSEQIRNDGGTTAITFAPDTSVHDSPYRYVSVYPESALNIEGSKALFRVPALQSYTSDAADPAAYSFYDISASYEDRPASLDMVYTGVSGLLTINFSGISQDETILNTAVTSVAGANLAGTKTLNLSTGDFLKDLSSTSSTINAAPAEQAGKSPAVRLRTLPVGSGKFDVTLVTDRNIYKWKEVQMGPIVPGMDAEASLSVSEATRQDELRILLIGNSFTQDACHQLPALLCGFAPAIGPNGFKVTLCQCYYGGRTVPQYNEGWNTSSDYTKHYAAPGASSMTDTKNQSLKNVAESGRWDIVTIQEHTGAYLAWEWTETEKKHFEQLIEKVAATQEVRPQFYYIFSQTYQDFGRIGSSSVSHMTFTDQAGMFDVTSAFARHVVEELPFVDVIPTGTMLQNLRQTPLCNPTCLSRDGYHMDYGIARYGAACCCYMQMIWNRCGQIPLSQNTYRNANADYTPNAIRTPITDANVPYAQQAALDAIASPWTVTCQTHRYGGEGSAGADPGIVDQGTL